MPVHAAGSRLYSALKFRHLVKRHGSGMARESNISLNLVPFVDLMTILVCFLLMVFSATNVLSKTQKGLELPIAFTKVKLQGAPIIMITKGEITVFNGRTGTPITTIETVLRDEAPQQRIERLFEVLEAAAKEIKADVLAEVVPTDSQADLSQKDMKKACELHKAGQRPAKGEPMCPDGLAILQADETTDVRVINKVVNTAKQAGFDNLMFAIKNK